MADFSSNIGNYCPNNSGGGNLHEPAQCGDPSVDAESIAVITMSPTGYSCYLTFKVCKHCGVLYGTSLIDYTE